ncbi:hypothetical protein BD770DRAFT_313996, partial [Pilaira anomala]
IGLLLAIVFLLVESTTNVNRLRAILSITILLTMICYNIKTRPCYVDKINFFRTASFTCILWTSALVAILSDTDAAQSLGPLAVIYIIIGGWIFIIFVFIIIYFIYYIQPPDHIMIDDNNTAVESDELNYYNSSNQELGYLTDQSSSNNNYRDGTIHSAISEPQQQQNATGWFGNTSVSRWLFGSSNNTSTTSKDYY